MIALALWLTVLLAGAAATLAGLLAPVHPPVDFLNHFRPFAMAGAVVLLAAAIALRAPRPVSAGAMALAGLNAGLLLLPLVWSAEPAERAVTGQALAGARERDIKMVTFNTAYGDARAVARFLLQEDPDIVVLQEVGAGHVGSLRMLLRDTHPHVHSCAGVQRCDAAIFAKRPWVASGQEGSSRETPEAVWVQFDDAEMGRLRVVGVHLHLPFSATTQTRQIDWLIAQRASFTGPAIVAGDFNMTPWSYRQQRLLAAAGLRRHAMFQRSWPTRRYPRLRLPFPAFLIDHVLSTPDIRSVSIHTGPVVGSDHLPVVARVRLPPA
jgi:endonuclease/exonuclease/phosphatase (EEP) superfamily protein YafD